MSDLSQSHIVLDKPSSMPNVDGQSVSEEVSSAPVRAALSPAEEQQLYLHYWETTGSTRVYKPPMTVPEGDLGTSIFLAGSIEQDKAEKWQEAVTKELLNSDITIFNPRRNNWDPTWEQRGSNHEFSHQVNWELDALDRADVIAMYFDPKTLSPITLLEFGFYAKSGRLIVGCPEGYWRRGNLEVMCDRFDVELHDTYQEWYDAVIKKIEVLKQKRAEANAQ